MIGKWYKTKVGSNVLYNDSIVVVVDVIGDSVLYKYAKRENTNEPENYTFNKQLELFLSQVTPLSDLDLALL